MGPQIEMQHQEMQAQSRSNGYVKAHKKCDSPVAWREDQQHANLHFWRSLMQTHMEDGIGRTSLHLLHKQTIASANDVDAGS